MILRNVEEEKEEEGFLKSPEIAMTYSVPIFFVYFFPQYTPTAPLLLKFEV